MAKITTDATVVMRALVSLSKRLADAVLWIYPRKGKLRLDVELTATRQGRIIEDWECWLIGLSPERAEAEILLAVLRAMRKRGPRKPTPKRRRGK
ncbi:MAG TPA: hypothetical protein PLB02_03305 [Thermoanaerobaculia bacterium]|nr:hypothetical protein [Thermoanaerobaculia bacterium]HQR66400.1 hypothetical protein [Thermoanaerobaculia bacterium]